MYRWKWVWVLIVVVIVAFVFCDPVQAGMWKDYKQEHPIKLEKQIPVIDDDRLTPELMVEMAEWQLKLRKKYTQRWERFIDWKESLQVQAPSSPSYSPGPYVPRGEIEAMICSVFGDYCGIAVIVADCESGLNPNAQNAYSGAAGLFQFIPSWWEGKWDPFDPMTNITHAFSASEGGTNWYTHWAASVGCWG